jgi:glycosyltransferase involved in cell wall biosynthesis
MKHKQDKSLSVAIIYDRVNTSYGGAEIVLTAIHEIFPDAPIFTSVYHSQKANWAKNIKIIPTFLQKIPFLNDKHQFLLPLMPLAFETLNLSSYDLIISVTSAEAKGVITKPNQLHICYMLTPTRYLYSHKKEYLASRWFLKLPIIKNLATTLINHVHRWDQTAINRPDIIIPISNLVSKRIKTHYNRQPSKVLYPPVSIQLSTKQIGEIPLFTGERKFFLSVSRLVDYKRVDLSIEACMKLQKPLVVVGEGESRQKLIKLAGNFGCVKSSHETLEQFLHRATQKNKIIMFTGKLSQEEVYKLFKNCDALLMPGQEDFGITALEAGIFGKPVILFYTSGVAELLQENRHAVFIKAETVPEMVYALGKFDSLDFDADALRQNALKYNADKFKQDFKQRVDKELKGHYVVS